METEIRNEWLNAEAVGRERLRLLLQQWKDVNRWSLAVMSRLAELSLLANAPEPIPDWRAGMELVDGGWVNHEGHVWEAQGRPATEPGRDAHGWRDVSLVRRLHGSGVSLFLRGSTKESISSTFLLELGRLNQWVANVQAGRTPPPRDKRLRVLVLDGVVLRDEQGVYGPEELLSVAIGMLTPISLQPEAKGAAAQQGAGERPIDPSAVAARRLRKALAAAGLDLVDDWPAILSHYPTDDPERQLRLRDALTDHRRWSAEELEDEQLALDVLLRALKGLAEPAGGVAKTLSAGSTGA